MTISDETLAGYAEWVGREETARCVVTAESCDLMAATLDRRDPPYRDGDPLPPMWIAMGFRNHARRSEIGPDGHPARGGFLPPVALPRRMFAGARHAFPASLPIGVEITRVSRIASVTPKRGKSGLMVFVTVRQTYSAEGVEALVEEQDIVYREAARPGEPAAAPVEPKPIPHAPWSAVWEPDPVTLFRFSALTWNGHRIHYDRRYVMEEEGYPGLVVHGPLTATLLANLCRDSDARPLASWEFRARRPLFDDGPLTVTGALVEDGAAAELTAWNHAGQACMTARAVFAG
jgi:3-methylfumaryl-CoA hydratase